MAKVKALAEFSRKFGKVDLQDLEPPANCNHVVYNRYYGIFNRVGKTIDTVCRNKATNLVMTRWVPAYDPNTQTYHWKIVQGVRVLLYTGSTVSVCDSSGCRLVLGLPKVVMAVLRQHLGERIVVDTEKLGGQVFAGKFYLADDLPFPIPDPPKK